MYNDDTRNAYSKLLEYVEGKYDNIESDEDFRNKFQELLENDEDFRIMIEKFNNVNVYNADAIHSAKDFLNLGEKLFPGKEENDLTDETKILNKESASKNVTEAPKVSTTPSVDKSKITTKTSSVPFYKKAINFVHNMPDITKMANAVSLGVFGTLTLFNAIGGGGLFYVGATLGLPIPAITATYYAGKAIYKSYKSGKIRKWLDRNKKEYEPLPTYEISENFTKGKSVEPITENKMDDMGIFFPNPDIKKDEPVKVKPILEPIKPVETTPVVSTEGGKEDKEETSHFNPATDLPVFENPDKKIDIPVTEPKRDEPEHETVPEPKFDTYYDSNDFSDIVTTEVSNEVPEIKEENKGRHVKKNMQNLEEGYKERRIAELESEIARLEDVKRTLNAGPIFKEDDDKKALVSRMIKENSAEIEKNTKELNELKGAKEEKNLAALLRSRKATLTRKLAKLEDTKENEDLRNNIKVAISQIDRYINLDKQVRNNPLATDVDKKRLAQVESATYTTVEYVLDGTKSTSRRGK